MSGAPIFVVQRHAARQPALRLSPGADGALASWAVPKGVPLEPGAGRSRCTSRTTRSSTRTFAGEIPPGSTAPGRSRSGIAAPTSSLEEKRDGGLTVRLHGSGYEGVWTLVPAHLDGKEQNWLLLREADDGRPAGGAAHLPADARNARRRAAGGRGLDLRGQVRRLPRARLCPRRRLRAAVPRNDNDLTTRFADVATAVAARGADAERRARRRGLRARRARDGRASRRCSRAPARLVYYAFDLLEARRRAAGRRARSSSAGDGSRSCSTAARPDRALLRRASTTARRCSTRSRAQGLEGVMAKRRSSQYCEGKRTRDWLKVKTHGRQEFVVAGYTRGEGRRAGQLRLARARRQRGRRAALRRQRRDGVRRARRSIACSRLLRPLERKDPPFAAAAEDAAGAQGRRRLGRAEARRGGRVQRVDARRPRPPAVVQGAPRGQGARRGAARAAPADGRSQGQARARALQPRQALLARRGDHEGRPARLLPAGRARARAAPGGAAVHDAPLSRRRHGQGVLPEGRALAHAGVDPDLPRACVDAGTAATKKWVDFPLVERRARAALDGEHGLHRHEHVVLADRQARPARLRPLRPRPDAGGAVGADDRGRAARQGAARRARARVVPEDLGRQGVPHPRAARPALDLRRLARVRRARGGHDRALHPKLATTQWSKAKRARGADRREPEREGKTIASVYSVRPHPGAPVSTPLDWDEVDPSSTRARSRWRSCSSGSRSEATSTTACSATRQSLEKALAAIKPR